MALDATVAQVDSGKALEAIFGKPDENGAFSGSARNERQARAKYWRKPEYEGATDAGWITAGPDIQTDAPKYQQYAQDKKYRELPDYFGKQITGQPDSTIHWEGPRKAYMTRPAKEGGVPRAWSPERWLEPFIANGGLTYIIQPNDTFGTPGTYLMPASQIVALGLHRRPGVKEMRPDLATATDLECPYGCIDQATKGRRLFAGLTREDAQRSVDQHIIAVHKEALASRAVGDEISKAMLANGNSGVDAATIAATVAAVLQSLGIGKPEPVAEDLTDPNGEPPPQAEEVESVFPVAFEGTIDVITPAPAVDAVPDETWKRQDLMAYARTKGIPRPEAAMSMNTQQWLAYVREQEERTNVSV